jgi:hypothetical protein
LTGGSSLNASDLARAKRAEMDNRSFNHFSSFEETCKRHG